MFSTGLIWGVSWFWYLAGFLGFGGAVAALYLAGPVVVVPVVQAAFRFLIGTRVGVGILVGCIAFMVADIRRSRMDTADFAERTAAFERAQDNRDKRIEQKTEERVWTEIANQTALNVETDKEVKEFRDAPPPPLPKTGNVFRIGDSDAKRLCTIAYGKAGCGPAGGKRVPEARRARRGAENSRVRFPDAVRRIVGDN